LVVHHCDKCGTSHMFIILREGSKSTVECYNRHVQPLKVEKIPDTQIEKPGRT